VTISNGPDCPFPPAVAAVNFGGTKAFATVQSNGTILASAPSPGLNDASVPVAVTLNDGTIVGGGDTTFSFPMAEMSVTGPLPANPSPIGETDQQWANGNNHILQINTPNTPPNNTLTFGIAAPVLHVSIVYNDSGQKENASAPLVTQVIGNQGLFAATLQVCDISATAPVATLQQTQPAATDIAPRTAFSGPPAFDASAPCTNWDQNTGYWANVVTQQATLNDPMNSSVASGDLVLPAASAFHPATYDFAHTFRIVLSLAEIDTVVGTTPRRDDALYGLPFTVVLLPTAMVQLKVLPFTIVFAPPGNLSTSSFQTTSSYNTNYSLGSSNESSNTSAQETSSSTQESAKLSTAASILSASASQTSSYDTTTSQSYGTLTGTTGTGTSTQQAVASIALGPNPATVPGNGQTCASTKDCSPQSYATDPNWFVNQPYWDDTFELLVHPQFVAFALGSAVDRYVYWAAAPVLATVQVWQLSACANNQMLLGTVPCQIPYSYSWLNSSQQYVAINSSLTLTAQEAANLLQLDPFYAAGTQNPPLPTTRAVLFPGPQVPYGMKFVPCPASQTCTPSIPQTYTATLSNTQVTGSGANGQQTYTNSLTNVVGNSDSIGLSFTMPTPYVTGTFGIQATSGDKSTTTTQSQMVFKNSTAASSSTATQAMVKLDDCDSSAQGQCVKSPHLPLPQQPSALIYLDKIFGGFMFVDPNAPKPLPAGARLQLINSINLATLLAIATTGEQSMQRFPDVPKSLAEQGAIGVLGLAGILPAMPDGKFYPQSGLTRVQLATAWTRYLKLRPPATPMKFSDVSAQDAYVSAAAAAVAAGLVTPASATQFGPNDLVTRQEMAVSLAKAFGLTKKPIAMPAMIVPPKFSDAASVAPGALESVQVVIGAGYMSVFADGTFKPSESVTRADAAQELYAAIKDNVK